MKTGPYVTVENQRFFRNYMNGILKFAILTREEERELLQLAHAGNEKARKRLICSNLRMVAKVALMYRGQGLPVLDLINEGSIGLMKAVLNFNLARKVRFTSYAIWWIRQAIVQALFDKARMVRISSASELAIRRISRRTSSTRQVIGGEELLDTRRTAESMGHSESHIQKLMAMNRRPISLNTPVSTDVENYTMEDIMINGSSENPDEGTDRRILHETILKLLNRLDPRERKVITYSFGLESNVVMNLRELGEILGISKERIRQIKESALRKLKRMGRYREYLQAA